MLSTAGAKPVRLPARSPNLNAYAERFVRSIKSECLRKIVPLGEAHLRSVVREYVERYRDERNHQGIGNVIPFPRGQPAMGRVAVKRRERLGGILIYIIETRRRCCTSRSGWTRHGGGDDTPEDTAAIATVRPRRRGAHRKTEQNDDLTRQLDRNGAVMRRVGEMRKHAESCSFEFSDTTGSMACSIASNSGVYWAGFRPY